MYKYIQKILAFKMSPQMISKWVLKELQHLDSFVNDHANKVREAKFFRLSI